MSPMACESEPITPITSAAGFSLSSTLFSLLHPQHGVDIIQHHFIGRPPSLHSGPLVNHPPVVR